MSNEIDASSLNEKVGKSEVKDMVLNDYRIMMESREASVLGRREVLTGKAKFGIFGDGKELAQLCLAKQFMDGDYRSGYYRDQTIMLALGEVSLQEYYAQLFSDTNVENEPHSGGRQMNCHYGTRFINDDGTWKDMTKMKITTTDLSPTAGQIPRIMGLGLASKLFRENKELHQYDTLSNKGNEVVFGTIGDGSTSEGIFLEAINAMGVLQIPVVMSVWDDGHAISVPVEKQTTKGSISEALKGFAKEGDSNGIEIIKVRGWNYPELCAAYDKAAKLARETHTPVLVHVIELTQPQGHSTSGSHERYKSKDRLTWEKEYDCTRQFKKWILENNWATEEELDEVYKNCKKSVKEGRNAAWKNYITPLKLELAEVLSMIDAIASKSRSRTFIKKHRDELTGQMDIYRNYMVSAAKKVLRLVRFEDIPEEKQRLADWLNEQKISNHDRYNSLLYAHGDFASVSVKEVKPIYAEEPNPVDGRIVLRENFDAILASNPKVAIFGEDTGKIGGVNQGCEGLQDKYGALRVFDTGIREAVIMGKGSGMAIRGLRPIAEIQYLDYLVYALMTLTDDVASLHWRTKGGQKAPMIIRTRGHRFEGIWHSGSPLGMIINSLRGFVVCVPRNMTQAAGMYNTLLEAHDPGLVIEPLLMYRKKEELPTNLGEFRVPLGIPDVIEEGTDVTIITYGSCVGIAQESVRSLREVGISAELIDVQTLLPFDTTSKILKSLEKTNRLIVLDEDVTGGATGFMLQQVLEGQGGYFHLDSEPRTLSAQDHRSAYGSDGNYFTKPNPETIFDVAYEIMHEVDPEKFPSLY